MGADTLGLEDRDPGPGLEPPEPPPLLPPSTRAWPIRLAADGGRSCCGDGAALQGGHQAWVG